MQVVDIASIVWAVVALAAVVACWDGVRRYAAAKGVQATVLAKLEAHEAALNKRFADLGERITDAEQATVHVARELEREAATIKAHAGIRTM